MKLQAYYCDFIIQRGEANVTGKRIASERPDAAQELKSPLGMYTCVFKMVSYPQVAPLSLP